MAEKIATREAYGKALAALSEQYPELVCFDADLAGATMTKFFKAACPERFFDMGIAECDMVGVAAGMATCGYKPFVNTFAMFAAGRAWEQVRNSVCYPHLNVKVVGSHGGLSVGEDGATHQAIEDIAIMRALPGMILQMLLLGSNIAPGAATNGSALLGLLSMYLPYLAVYALAIVGGLLLARWLKKRKEAHDDL